MFLIQAVAHQGFPFEIKKYENTPYQALTEDEFLFKLESARKSAMNGDVKSAELVISDIKGKYEL